jgi:anaerobic magnesium-protoporphyrin IX monomethyl ester cyclase
MRKRLRIAFLQTLTTELMGTMCVSAVLKQAGHETRMFLESQEPNLVRSVLAWEPDVVGVSIITGMHVWALQVCRRIKEAAPRVRVVLGGPHATFVPEVVDRPGVDVVVRGEGDYAMRDLCDAIAAHDDYAAVPGTWVKDERGVIHENAMGALVTDLDALPSPDRALPYRYPILRRRGNKTFIPGRGCAFPCTFCHNHLGMRLYRGQGKWARKMSPERFIEQIVDVRDNWGPLRIVNLENDDEILHLRGWVEPAFTLYAKRVGLPYYVMTRPDSVTDDIARLLKETGCVGVSMSLETANDRLRNEVLKKQFERADVENAMACLDRHGISVKMFNMLGIPGETLEDALATLEMNSRLKPMWARCSILQPYPPMDLYQMCKREGLFKQDFETDDFEFFYLKESPLDFPGIDRLVNLQKFFSITAKYPFLLPLVRQLIKVRPNRIYEFLGMLFYGYFGARFDRLTLKEFVEFALASASFLTRRGSRARLAPAAGVAQTIGEQRA